MDAPSAPSTGTGIVKDDGCVVPSLMDPAIRRTCRRCPVRSATEMTWDAAKAIRYVRLVRNAMRAAIEHGLNHSAPVVFHQLEQGINRCKMNVHYCAISGGVKRA